MPLCKGHSVLPSLRQGLRNHTQSCLCRGPTPAKEPGKVPTGKVLADKGAGKTSAREKTCRSSCRRQGSRHEGGHAPKSSRHDPMPRTAVSTDGPQEDASSPGSPQAGTSTETALLSRRPQGKAPGTREGKPSKSAGQVAGRDSPLFQRGHGKNIVSDRHVRKPPRARRQGQWRGKTCFQATTGKPPDSGKDAASMGDT